MNKFIISTGVLAPALKKLGQAVPKNSLSPILFNLLVKASAGQAVFIASDLEVTIHYRLEAECKTEFEFLVPFEFLNKIVALSKNMPLTFEIGKTIKILDDKDVYEVKSPEKVELYPKLQEMPDNNSVDLDAPMLAALHTALATTGTVTQASEFVLLELEPEKITVASSDNIGVVYSLQFPAPVNDTQKILLSNKVIKVLDGCTEAKVFYNEKIAGFVSGDITIINTRTEVIYFDFRRIFPPDWPANLTINRNDLLEALVKCSISSDKLKTTVVDLDEPGDMKLTADDKIVQIKPVVPCTYTGKVMNTQINSDKMIKLLHQVDYGEIQFAIHDKNRALVLTSETNPGYRAMIMPIAQQEKKTK